MPAPSHSSPPVLSLQATGGRSRGMGGRIPFHIPSQGQIATSSSAPLGAQSAPTVCSPSDALKHRSEEQSLRPDLEKHLFSPSAHSCVTGGGEEGGDLITLNYHKLYRLSRRADFRCKEGRENGGGKGKLRGRSPGKGWISTLKTWKISHDSASANSSFAEALLSAFVITRA